MIEIFNILFTNPITNVLVACYQLFLFLHIPYPLGFSIILLTIIIKFILSPFMSAQIKSSHKMQKMTPHMAAIKEKHKEDKKKQQEELMKLYKEHGINPAAGCLPILIQIPVIWALYHVLTQVVGATSAQLNQINSILYSPVLKLDKIWNTDFFGIPLAKTPTDLFSVMPLIVLIPVITGVIQFILSKMMVPHGIPKPKKDDFQSAMQTQTLFLIPAMIGFFSFSLPIGLSLYWNTLNIFGILQQHILVGPGALQPWLEKTGIYGKRKS